MTNDLRLFIAVPVIPKLRRKFFNLANQLKTAGADVKWVSEENFHITLKFLGDTPPEKVGLITEALNSTLSGFDSFRIKFNGVGVFPNRKRPKVVWVGLGSAHTQIAAMAQAVENALEPLGFEKESRPFKSHLTIGRIRSTGGTDELMKQLDRLKDFDGGNMKLEEIHLVRSELTGSGPVYTVEHKFPLKNEEENNGN